MCICPEPLLCRQADKNPYLSKLDAAVVSHDEDRLVLCNLFLSPPSTLIQQLSSGLATFSLMHSLFQPFPGRRDLFRVFPILAFIRRAKANKYTWGCSSSKFVSKKLSGLRFPQNDALCWQGPCARAASRHTNLFPAQPSPQLSPS